MAWKKQGKGGVTYLKFEAGKSIEGVYKGAEERKNPFGEGNIYDYKIEINGVESVISSTSQGLLENLYSLPNDSKVKIDMLITSKGRKVYNVFVDE